MLDLVEVEDGWLGNLRTLFWVLIVVEKGGAWLFQESAVMLMA
jgi:hypothetical protein